MTSPSVAYFAVICCAIWIVAMYWVGRMLYLVLELRAAHKFNDARVVASMVFVAFAVVFFGPLAAMLAWVLK